MSPNDGQLWRLDACALARGYADGAFTPLQVAEASLARIACFEPQLNAMACVDAPGARAAAVASTARWQAGRPLGPLDGVPLTLKDNLHAAGLPTRWGSKLGPDAPLAADELPIERARAAGLVVLGKTCLPEFALQGCTVSPLTGVTRNPWDWRLTPGGSSGGAAASVAAGYAPLALATDGGGSIRRPAAYTGLIGIKPSRGLVPRSGGLPDLFLGHEDVGGLARTAGDLRRLLEVLSGRSVAALPAPAMRILVLSRLGPRPVDKRLVEMVQAVADSLAAQGHRVTREDRADWAEDVHALWPRLSASGLAWLIDGQNAWPGAALRTPAARLAACGDATQALYEDGRRLGAADLFALGHAVQRLHETLAGEFSRFDVLLTPATASMAWPADEPFPRAIDGRPAGPRADAVFTPFANAAGLPAVSLPCTMIGGLPAGCQLAGPHGSDARLLALAEQITTFHPWAPPGARMPVLERLQ
ncbi:amidase [Xenophilus aerolatus]|nr:amidase [Xenophilus aerolatus]